MAKRRSAPPARTDTEALVYRWGPSIDTQLLDLALTHRSYAHENGGLPTNERLEFLGDSVLGIIVTEYLYRTHPEVPEGQLAKMRAATVSEPDLAAVARVCQRALVMDGGAIVEDAPMRRLLTEPAHPATRALRDAVPTLPTATD